MIGWECYYRSIYYNFVCMKRTNNLIDCPRCLGKGHVDLQDIKRLRRELFWEPGPHCAYCDGKKVVELDFATNINADDWFITSDVDQEILQRYLDKDPKVIKEAREMEENIRFILDFIYNLYINEDKERGEIVNLLLQHLKITKKEAEDYVDSVIKLIFSNLLN